MKKLLLASVALATLSTAAFAADLPYRRAAPAPYVAVPTFTWSGFYVGVNGGYAFGDKTNRTYTETFLGDFNLSDTVPGRKLEGGFGGGQVGYNAQFGSLVAGLEADLQGADIDASRRDFTSATSGYTYNGGNRVSYFGTVRGRLGYAMDRFLVYGTGGFAYGDVKSSFSYNDNIAPFLANASKSKTQSGWTVGAGLEYAVTANWTVKAEYLYVSLPGARLSAPETNAGAPTSFAILTRDKDINLNIVRAGLNYKF